MKYDIDTQKLRIAMIRNGIDNYENLAEKANLSRNTISRIVNSKGKPTLNVIYAICEVLKLSSSEAGEIFFASTIA